MKRIWLFPGVLYVFLVLVELIAVTFGFQDLHFVVKPMLMPMLAATALVMFQSKAAPKAIPGLLLAALACHTAGDIFLLFDGGKMFIYGLLAFLTGHIFYIAILGANIRENTMTENPVSLPRILIYTTVSILLPAGIGFIARSASGHAALGVYAGIYAWILTSMAYLSGRTACLHLEGGKLVLPGALLFIVSDSLLALHSFLGVDFPFRHTLVMLTYTAAQALLVCGIGKFYKTTEEKACPPRNGR